MEELVIYVFAGAFASLLVLAAMSNGGPPRAS